MNKKIIGIFIIMLLTCTIYPASANVIIDRTYNSTMVGNTLYVGGSGTNNYTNIQDAIDDAFDGDTVFVYDDSSPYRECIIIQKSGIKLIGEDKETTIIDGDRQKDKDVIQIKADGINIQHFTIKGSELEGSSTSDNRCGIEILSNYNIISDNIITDNYQGIQMGLIIGEYPNNVFISANNNLIKENFIENNMGGGLLILCSSNNNVTNNIFSSHEYFGIEISDDESKNNIIQFNEISNNNIYGISIHGTNNIIYRNSIFNNNAAAVRIGWCTKNLIIENNFYDNKNICFWDVNSWNIFLRGTFNNTFDGNYWGRAYLFPKPIIVICILMLPTIIGNIFGLVIPIFIPLPKFDLHPAKEPYDI